MNVIEFSLCALGAFYAFAGYVATRAALTSHMVDQAIAAIGGGGADRRETARTVWLLAAAVVVLAGGVALMALLHAAVWLFLASAAGQAIYLFVLAPRYFDVADPPDSQGRRGTTNAFVIYLVATALVVWSASKGALADWQDVHWLRVAAPIAVVLAHAGHAVWTLLQSPRGAGLPPSAGGQEAPARDPSECTRIKVMSDYHCHALWALDEDLYGDFAPERLGLSPELTRDLNAWAEAYTASYDPDDPAVSRWTGEQVEAHEAEARPLARRLARERPDRRVYVMDFSAGGVVEVKADEQT